VSKRPEKLTQTASAIQVITGKTSAARARRICLTPAPPDQFASRANQMHTTGALPRALQREPFATNTLGDKLLVLIDGAPSIRPCFSGVYWDVQNVNAGGCRPYRSDQRSGWHLVGSECRQWRHQHHHETRRGYAGTLRSSHRRLLCARRRRGAVCAPWAPISLCASTAQRMDYNSTDSADGGSARDGWNMNQAGFRMEYALPAVPSPSKATDMREMRTGRPPRM